MIEVKFICGFAQSALSGITLPNLDLHCRRNNPASLGIQMHWFRQIFFTLNGDQSKLVYVAVFVPFLPRVDQVKMPLYDQMPFLIFS